MTGPGARPRCATWGGGGGGGWGGMPQRRGDGGAFWGSAIVQTRGLGRRWDTVTVQVRFLFCGGRESGTVASLLTSAAAAPWRPSHAGAGNASHSVLPIRPLLQENPRGPMAHHAAVRPTHCG